jgi:hypothetical protein
MLFKTAASFWSDGTTPQAAVSLPQLRSHRDRRRLLIFMAAERPPPPWPALAQLLSPIQSLDVSCACFELCSEVTRLGLPVSISMKVRWLGRWPVDGYVSRRFPDDLPGKPTFAESALLYSTFR